MQTRVITRYIVCGAYDEQKKIERSIILLTIALTVAVSAGVYKWVDEKGTIHFSDKPPSGEKAVVVEPKKNEAEKSKETPLALEDQNALKEAEAVFNTREYKKFNGVRLD